MTTDKAPIAENSSKNTGRKRGRPRVLVGFREEVREKMGPSKTDPTAVDTTYALGAVDVLKTVGEPGEFDWLFNGKGWRRCILTELGRIGSRKGIFEMAQMLCKAKPKTREAMGRLRRMRLGKPLSGSAWDLRRRIAKLILDYGDERPDVSRELVKCALAGVLHEIERRVG